MYNSTFRSAWDRNAGRTFTVPVAGSSSPSVASISPRFVNIDTPWHVTAPPRRMDDTVAAVKIQSAFRGYSVRKTKSLESLKIIARVKSSMEEMRRRISDPHCVEIMRQNEKERLKIAEGVMSLLLKLDEIQGVESFVREARRAVAHELVSLHERVDAISTCKSTEGEGMEVPTDLQTREDESCNLGRAQEGRKGAGTRCWLRSCMRKVLRRSYWTD
ncbi:hypothetical protein KI387_030966 [Taxus chinensis]|uniref:BAG domain-containing protein n=1 Tax=Taxus chinensis TaxID=29808 RepID=A0AA38CLW7_TAXCH|nr:hypothetical protein KI387_030966 [Taxus chinensis]